MPSDISFSVVSWNCLADSYALAPKSGERPNYVSWKHRATLISEIIIRHNADIVCLQEVDHYDDHFQHLFAAHEYHVEYAQRKGRSDGVLIAFKTRKFQKLDQHIIEFDDLAEFSAAVLYPLKKTIFRRHNIALALILRTTDGVTADEDRGRVFTVATAHLHWNPLHHQVKDAQTQYLLQRLADMRFGPCQQMSCAYLLTGDFNSEPHSVPHKAVLTGCAYPTLARALPKGAARVAIAQVVKRERDNRDVTATATATTTTTVTGGNTAGSNEGGGGGRFLCDATLTKLARWLRLLGINTTLETKVSQEHRASENDFAPLFDEARREGRILVTTSTTMIKRNTCPETFLVRTPGSIPELKKSLASLLSEHAVKLDPKKFFTICSKCGGNIAACAPDDDAHLRAKFIPTDRKLYSCDTCKQVYWWGISTHGSSARARRLAHSLHSFIESNRKPVVERMANIDAMLEGNPFEDIPVCRQEWLKYRSAYEQVHGHEPATTNINGFYSGTLDYIFTSGALVAKDAKIEHHQTGSNQKHDDVFPNPTWPSDHMLLRADVSFKQKLPGGRSFFTRSFSDIR